jgi:2-isopropylmalate synthase
VDITGRGNGPIDAFFQALSTVGISGYKFVNYAEHAISVGSDAKAVSYIQLETPEGETVFGVVSPTTLTMLQYGVYSVQ